VHLVLDYVTSLEVYGLKALHLVFDYFTRLVVSGLSALLNVWLSSVLTW
jgi:hypothetical protein